MANDPAVQIGYQEDGSYVPCPSCRWTPPPPDPNERRRPGKRVRMDWPGCATHHGDCPTVNLSPEAERKLREDLDAIAECHRRARASAHNYWIG